MGNKCLAYKKIYVFKIVLPESRLKKKYLNDNKINIMSSIETIDLNETNSTKIFLDIIETLHSEIKNLKEHIEVLEERLDILESEQ